MIQINHLKYKDILQDVNFTINDGDFLIITGENGSGKSTLIKCILGINKVKHDMITIDGKCISCYKKFSQIGYVSQTNKLKYELPITVQEIIELISSDKKKIDELLNKYNIKDKYNEDINNLSGGQRQKVNLVKALVRDINYLILDEPETGLDKGSRDDLIDNLKELKKNGITIIIISHHVNDEIKSLASKIYHLDDNEMEIMNV